MWLPPFIRCLGEEPEDDVLYLAWELPYFFTRLAPHPKLKLPRNLDPCGGREFQPTKFPREENKIQ